MQSVNLLCLPKCGVFQLILGRVKSPITRAWLCLFDFSSLLAYNPYISINHSSLGLIIVRLSIWFTWGFYFFRWKFDYLQCPGWASDAVKVFSLAVLVKPLPLFSIEFLTLGVSHIMAYIVVFVFVVKVFVYIAALLLTDLFTICCNFLTSLFYFSHLDRLRRAISFLGHRSPACGFYNFLILVVQRHREMRFHLRPFSLPQLYHLYFPFVVLRSHVS